MTMFRQSVVLLLSARRTIDLRSDTVTRPSRAMLETALTASTGDDVMGEDPTIQALEEYVADRLGKAHGLFVPTGTMGNLCALSAHCDRRGMEVLVGSQSHICLYESGNVSTAANLHSRQLQEDPVTAEFTIADIVVRQDDDDHYCPTQVLCLENTHNMLGGIPLQPSYINRIGEFCRSKKIKLHMDGARLANAVIANGVTAAEVCRPANSITICLSKGLGAPLGSVLVSDDSDDFYRLAKRARKRYGGGMRQAGVVAAMGLYAMEHNWDRILLDHERAKALAKRLSSTFIIGMTTTTQPQTNMVYFRLPEDANVTEQEFLHRLKTDFSVLLWGGFRKTGNVFRAVMHLDLTDEDIEIAGNAMVQCLR